MSTKLHIVANLSSNLQAKWLQDHPSWLQYAPKMPQDASKMAPRHPKLEPRWPQERPSRAKMRPRCFQDGLPRVQVQYQRSGHAAATYPAGVATGRPLIVGRSKAPQVAQLSLNWASTWLKMASTWPQHGSKMFPTGPLLSSVSHRSLAELAFPQVLCSVRFRNLRPHKVISI